jgi:hypothetical protein
MPTFKIPLLKKGKPSMPPYIDAPALPSAKPSSSSSAQMPSSGGGGVSQVMSFLAEFGVPLPDGALGSMRDLEEWLLACAAQPRGQFQNNRNAQAGSGVAAVIEQQPGTFMATKVSAAGKIPWPRKRRSFVSDDLGLPEKNPAVKRMAEVASGKGR